MPLNRAHAKKVIYARAKAAGVRYEDLTPEQKAKICNGCGGKGGWFNPPEFCFHASCNHHDFNYWLGGDEEDRKKADKQFYAAMLEDCERYKGLRKYYYRSMAWVYYRAVRMCGSQFFNYHQ